MINLILFIITNSKRIIDKKKKKNCESECFHFECFSIFLRLCIFDHLNCCHKTHLLFFISSDLQRRLQDFFLNFGKMYILAKSINTYLRV